MIRVTVDMWPQGDESRKYPLGSFDIINTGTGAHPAKGNYLARFYSKAGVPLQRDCNVNDWPRLSKPVLSLLRACLEKAGF